MPPATTTARPAILGGTGIANPVAAATAATATEQPPLAAAAPEAPHDPPRSSTGTVYSATMRPDRGGRQSRWVRALSKIRIGAHVASAAALTQIRPVNSASGLILGFDADGKVATARVFRPEPSRIALVGGLWAARILVFRALAVGANVVVLTDRPSAWQGMGPWATGQNDRVGVYPLGYHVPTVSTALHPVMVLQDGTSLGTAAPTMPRPWQAQVTVVPQLTAHGFPAIRQAELVITQRLTPEEAAAVTPLLGLDRATHTLIRALQEDMFALLDSGGPRYIWAQPTSIERQHFGPPHRFEAPPAAGPAPVSAQLTPGSAGRSSGV